MHHKIVFVKVESSVTDAVTLLVL